MTMAAEKPDQNDSTAIYTLGVVSKLSGIPVHSILQYINKGLIIPFKKVSRRNLFSDADISRLKYIRHLLEDRGLNIAGIRALMAHVPCWSIHKCSEKDRKNCEAYHSSMKPCWEVTVKGSRCKNIECRQCSIYIFPLNKNDLKYLVKQATN